MVPEASQQHVASATSQRHGHEQPARHTSCWFIHRVTFSGMGATLIDGSGKQQLNRSLDRQERDSVGGGTGRTAGTRGTRGERRRGHRTIKMGRRSNSSRRNNIERRPRRRQIVRGTAAVDDCSMRASGRLPVPLAHASSAARCMVHSRDRDRCTVPIDCQGRLNLLKDPSHSSAATAETKNARLVA